MYIFSILYIVICITVLFVHYLALFHLQSNIIKIKKKTIFIICILFIRY